MWSKIVNYVYAPIGIYQDTSLQYHILNHTSLSHVTLFSLSQSC